MARGLITGFLLVLCSVDYVLADSPKMIVTGLRCEYLTNPVGIDEQKPRLSWRLESLRREKKQSAYRVLVASTEKRLQANHPDLWDSGKVVSQQTTQIAYQGKPLPSRQHCFWTVQVWDESGKPFFADQTATWSMGLLQKNDWSAKYISFRDQTPIAKDRNSHFLPPARQYRKQFQSQNKTIRRATVYASALGIYELHINGQRVGDAWFAPGWSDYRKRAYYYSYDVTNMLSTGENAIGAWVADGWYSGYVGFGLLVGIGTEKIGRYTYGKTPSLIAQLEIEYTDGTRQTIGTDESWKVTGKGPIRQADLLMGEFYDARNEFEGWSTSGFDDQNWEQAILAEQNGKPTANFYEFRNPSEPGKPVKIQGREVDLGFHRPELEAFPGVPVRVTEEIKPVDINQRSKGTYIFNLGQNFAGVVRLKLKGSAGQRVKIRYGEMLHSDGSLMTENLRSARATDYYVCKGDPQGEVYTPRFTFHGFQYVEVSNFPGEPNQDTLTGLVILSDTPLTSQFECSDPMVNRLFQNIVWTQRANFLDLPTDCPQRDERMGWTGDAQIYVGTAIYNADVAAFYSKWLRELMESQRPSGAFPGYAPFPFQHGLDFGTAWGDAGVICPWTIWQAYNDTRIIERCWKPMTRFMEWRKRTSQNYLGVNHGNHWGDWLSQGETTPLDYIDTVYFAISSEMMSQMAAAIGHEAEAESYQKLYRNIQKAFVKKYLNEDATLKVDTQTAYALAIYAGLIPEDLLPLTGQHLAKKVQDKGNHMATGFLGTRKLLPALSSTGQHDLATFLLQSHEFPSWGYEIDQGATTIWERWDSYTKEDGFGRHNAAMNSFAHYSFGAVCEWMFKTLTGIRTAGPGFQKIIIQPNPPAPGSNAQHQPIHWVRASYDSIHGMIKSGWKLEGDQFHLNVTIPANTTATVFLPTDSIKSITESGAQIENAIGVQLLRYKNGRAVLAIDSGSYQFVSKSGIRDAKQALKTFTPPDQSINPEKIDLQHAKLIMEWDFSRKTDAAKWHYFNSLKVVHDSKNLSLKSNQDDPQMVVEFEKPITGPLAVALKARPSKGSQVQFFWADASQGFNAIETTSRTLNPSQNINEYLFRIDSDKAIKALRFDPFSGQGQMGIESLSIYQLAK